MKIGAVTIGQAPRVDVTADIMRFFDGSVELVQAGGLDGMTKEEIAAFAPAEEDYVLVSRLQDGSSVTFAERHILPRLQEAVTRMEEEGCSLVMMFCTGSFPEALSTKEIPMIYPCELLNRLVPVMSRKSNIICMTPSPLQIEQCERKWKQYAAQVKAYAASPYGEWEALEKAAEEAKNMDGDLIVLDCIGYTQEMKEMFAEKTGKKVVLPRTLLARVVSELIAEREKKMSSLVKAAEGVLSSCLAVKPGEVVLVVTDDTRKEIGEAIYEAAGNLGCEKLLMVMKERELSGQEPPKAIAEAMKAADVVIAPAAQSLTHTNARIEAAKAGTRVATMPGVTKEMFFQGAMTANYDEVEKLTAVVTEMLTRAKTARIEKDGKILTISIDGRDGVPSPGVYREPGKCGNLPSGEAYIAPLENGSGGETIIDGSMVGIGKLESPLHMVISEGKLRAVTGEHSENLDVLLRTEENATLCELGIGTNEAAVLNGVILEDEKVYGTVHIAFGTNTSFGGVNKAECHMDGIILRPSLYLDDVKVIEEGKFLV